MSENKFAWGRVCNSRQIGLSTRQPKANIGLSSQGRQFASISHKERADGHERMVLKDRLDRQLGQVTAERSFPPIPSGKRSGLFTRSVISAWIQAVS
jgi:hypothetical protein